MKAACRIAPRRLTAPCGAARLLGQVAFTTISTRRLAALVALGWALAGVRDSADAKEGMAARLDKRPARFQGR